MVSEKNIDDSFPNGIFLIDGLSTPYRLDRNLNGSRLMLFQIYTCLLLFDVLMDVLDFN